MSRDEPHSIGRGGGCYSDKISVLLGERVHNNPSLRAIDLGFRLVRWRSPLERLADAGREVRDGRG